MLITRRIEFSASQIAMVALEDGSKVKLAPESKLRIPSKFGITVRGIRLVDGTAEITVAPSAKDSLEVRAGHAAITAASGILDMAVDSAAEQLQALAAAVYQDAEQ